MVDISEISEQVTKLLGQIDKQAYGGKKGNYEEKADDSSTRATDIAKKGSNMEIIPGVLLYDTTEYLGFEGIYLMEAFSKTIQLKLHNNSSAFNRLLRKYDPIDKELGFNDCKKEATVTDSFRSKTLVTLTPKSLRTFDPKTEARTTVPLHPLIADKFSNS